MKIVEAADAIAPLAEYASNISNGPVVVTDHGRPVAALVAIENADLETISLSTNRVFVELIERSRVGLQSKGGIPEADMRGRFK